MKTIQLNLDEDLLHRVDKVVKELKTTRSDLIKESLRLYLFNLNTRQMEERHRDGYRTYPFEKGEFDLWEDEQAWG